MRELVVLASAAVLCLGLLVDRSEATSLSASADLRSAIADADPIAQVHCAPGYIHHRWRGGSPTWDGCAGVVTPGVGVVVPGVGVGIGIVTPGVGVVVRDRDYHRDYRRRDRDRR